jgi:hypothetical protein
MAHTGRRYSIVLSPVAGATGLDVGERVRVELWKRIDVRPLKRASSPAALQAEALG